MTTYLPGGFRPLGFISRWGVFDYDEDGHPIERALPWDIGDGWFIEPYDPEEDDE